jgi:signal transduction histidine kinase
VDATSGKSASSDLIRTAERQRISRELHNSTSQLLVALQLQIGQLRCSLPPGAADCLLDEVAETVQSIHESIKQIGIQSGDEDDDILGYRQVQTARLFFLLSGANRASR